MHKLKRVLALVLSVSLIFQQTGFTQIASQIDTARYLNQIRQILPQGVFRPLHLRYLAYDQTLDSLRMFVDKGSLPKIEGGALETQTQVLFNYLLTGISLPNSSLWVNLRPDGENQIIDEALAKTDVGRVMLDADLQLKKDLALLTSPESPTGKIYWDKLYQKADQLLGESLATIPTLVRPWIVPGEVILRHSGDSAYIYKANLKVMLEQDYLQDSLTYNFTDPRLKALNAYACDLVRELILPQLTKEINTSQRYASLRQVFYSLVLAQWFKRKFKDTDSQYAQLIDSQSRLILTSPWSKTNYFNQYKESFEKGEYNLKQGIDRLGGKKIRTYVSGGVSLAPNAGKPPVDINSKPFNPGITGESVVTDPNDPDKIRTGTPAPLDLAAQPPANKATGSSTVVALSPSRLVDGISQHSVLSYDPADYKDLLPEAIAWAKEHGYDELTVNPNNLSSYISYLLENIQQYPRFAQEIRRLLFKEKLRGIEFEHALITYVIRQFVGQFSTVSYEVDADIELARFQPDWQAKPQAERDALETQMIEKTVAEIKRISSINPQKMMVKAPNTPVGHAAVAKVKRENPNIRINFTLFFSLEDSIKGLEHLRTGDVVSQFVSRIDALTQDPKYQIPLNRSQGLLGLIIAKQFYDYCATHDTKGARIIMASLGAKTKIPAWMYVYSLVGGKHILTMPRAQGKAIEDASDLPPIQANLDLSMEEFLATFILHPDCIAEARNRGFWKDFTEGEMTKEKAHQLARLAVQEWEDLSPEIKSRIFTTLAEEGFNKFYKPFADARTKIQGLEKGVLDAASSGGTADNKGSGPGITGGVDFRYLDAATRFEAIGPLSAFKMPQLPEINAIDIQALKQQLKHMIDMGKLPADERMMNLIAACYIRGEAEEDITSCLVEFFKLAELYVVDINDHFEQFLSTIEAVRLP